MFDEYREEFIVSIGCGNGNCAIISERQVDGYVWCEERGWEVESEDVGEDWFGCRTAVFVRFYVKLSAG